MSYRNANACWRLADVACEGGTVASGIVVDVTSSPFNASNADGAGVREAVAAAVAYAKSLGLRGIYFPDGNYKFSRAAGTAVQGLIDITGVDGFIVEGAGPKARLYQDAPSVYDTHFIRVFDAANRVVVRSLTIDGSYTGAVAFPGISQQNHLIKLGGGSSTSTAVHQVLIENCWLKNCRGDAINIIGETNSRGVLTFTGQPANNETVVLGVRTYTFKTALTGAAWEVLIGASTNASIDNLVSAINATAGAGTTYGTGTTINADASASRASSTLVATGETAGPCASTETVANASWPAATLPYIAALTDEVIIDGCFIYETHRTCVGIQRGCRKVIITGNHMKNANRGVIDFEPTGSNVDTEDYRYGNAPQQFIITGNTLEQSRKGNVVATLFGIGSGDRNKYSIFSDNICLGGGVNGLNAGPIIVNGNTIVGFRGAGGNAEPLLQFWRGADDVLISNNNIERPVPDDGVNTSNTLQFHPAVDDEVTPTQPAAGETAVVGAKTYTFRAALVGANDVLIGATLAETCANLVHAILDDTGEGTLYGTGTTANAAVTSATSDGESVTCYGTATTSCSETMAAGYWESASFLGAAGPLIEIQENGGTQPNRITIVGNHLRQHMPHHGIKLVSAKNCHVSGNALHFFGATQDVANGIWSDNATAVANHVHIKGNTIIHHDAVGRLNNGISIGTAGNMGHSSIVGNTVHNAKNGINYSGVPTEIPTVCDNDVSGISSTAYSLPTPTHIGGNHGGAGAPAIYQGAGAPAFTAAKFSEYMRTDGVVGSGGIAGTARYINTTGAAVWAAMIDG